MCRYVITFILVLLQSNTFVLGLECNCRKSIQCDLTTGECPYGCNYGDIKPNQSISSAWSWQGFWSGPACQIGNIAYNKDVIRSDVENGTMNWLTDGNFTWKYSPDIPYSNDAINLTVKLDGEYVIGRAFVSFITDASFDDLNQWQGAIHGVIFLGSFKDDELTITGPGLIGPFDHMTIPLSGRHLQLATQIRVEGYKYEDCQRGKYGPACVLSCDRLCQNGCHPITGTCSCTSGFSYQTESNACQDVNHISMESLNEMNDGKPETCFEIMGRHPWLWVKLKDYAPISRVSVQFTNIFESYRVDVAVSTIPMPFRNDDFIRKCIRSSRSGVTTEYLCSSEGRATFGQFLYIFFDNSPVSVQVCEVNAFIDRKYVVTTSISKNHTEIQAEDEFEPDVYTSENIVYILAGSTVQPSDGYVSQWRLTSDKVGSTVHLSIWRPTTGNRYVFIGAVQHQTKTEGFEQLEADDHGTVEVKYGDVLGISWSGTTPFRVKRSGKSCDTVHTSVGFDLTESNVGKEFDVQLAGNDVNCRIFEGVGIQTTSVTPAVYWFEQAGQELQGDVMTSLTPYQSTTVHTLDLCKFKCLQLKCRSFNFDGYTCNLFALSVQDPGSYIAQNESTTYYFYRIFETPVIDLFYYSSTLSSGDHMTITCTMSRIWPHPNSGDIYWEDNRGGKKVPSTVEIKEVTYTESGMLVYASSATDIRNIWYMATIKYTHTMSTVDHGLILKCVYSPTTSFRTASENIQLNLSLAGIALMNPVWAATISDFDRMIVMICSGVMACFVLFNWCVGYKIFLLQTNSIKSCFIEVDFKPPARGLVIIRPKIRQPDPVISKDKLVPEEGAEGEEGAAAPDAAADGKPVDGQE